MPDKPNVTRDLDRILREIWRDSTDESPFKVGQHVTTKNGPGQIISASDMGSMHTYTIRLDGDEPDELKDIFRIGTYAKPEDLREFHETEQTWRDHLAKQAAKQEATRQKSEAERVVREREARKLRNRIARRVTTLRYRLASRISPSEDYDYD